MEREGAAEHEGGGSRPGDRSGGGEAAEAARGGAAGLVSGHRGKRWNNAIDAAVRREVLELVRERYWDFGPTFAREKLMEEDRLSAETLRQRMMAEGLWRAKTRREPRCHPSRPRRECVGDLVHIDGSSHDCRCRIDQARSGGRVGDRRWMRSIASSHRPRPGGWWASIGDVVRVSRIRPMLAIGRR